MNGLPVEAHVGRTIPEVLPRIGPEVIEAFERVFATGQPLLLQEASGETPAAVGKQRYWSVNYYPIRIADEVRFVLTGHNAYEKALAPYPGITCKSLFIPTPADFLAGSSADLVAWLDARAAAWVDALPEGASPREMPPLPVFGFPGWLPDSACAGFYADRRWFRTGRKA